MEVRKTIVLPVTITLAFVIAGAFCYLFWRYVWFFRNPHRIIPPDGSGILSPADGTVVYVRQMKPRESVINIKGGLEAGKTFYDSLKLITRLVNVGDAKSLACHPASTTHRQMSAEEQRIAGVLPETIRLSIGIEHSSDIIEDIDQALAQACSRHQRLEAAE